MIVALADDHLELLAGLSEEDLVIERLKAPSEMLDRGFELLQQHFDSAVLDSKEVYVDRMSESAASARDFLPSFVVSYFECQDYRLIASFISADIMWLTEPSDGAILAIGNIGTSKSLREIGFRGAGSAVLDASINIALREVTTDRRRMTYVVAEAEESSLYFWKRRGFLLPTGCNYQQPPLDWDDAGNPVHGEVKEKLLVLPIQMRHDVIEPNVLQSIIAAICDNWSLRRWRSELSPRAFVRAEEYVNERVVAPMFTTIPRIPLPMTRDY